MSADQVRVLKLTLHGSLVGYLAGFSSGRNVLSFDHEFIANSNRPTFSLITHSKFPNSNKLLDTPWARNQRLHPTLSNLLPEGALRDLLAQSLKVHSDNEFQLFAYLGEDLPGALIATPMEPAEVPAGILTADDKAQVVSLEKITPGNKFSLAGVQMKFSMKELEGRYNFATDDDLGDWIIKTPSTRHTHVPLNEYTAMMLASMVGIDIPDIKLVDLNTIDNLPPINLPSEQHAFAIRRFDRSGQNRIHMEDFAQVLVKYPHEKYSTANYEQIGKIIYEYSGDGLADVQQFARRLLVNILLGNGDAHLKNWSLTYPDRHTPRLSPAYDIVTTLVYIEGETEFALNLARNKHWYDVTQAHFQVWAKKSGVPWRAIKPHLDETIDKARAIWPSALEELPMASTHKTALRDHWQKLHSDFRIE